MHLRRGTNPGFSGAYDPPQDFGGVSDVPRCVGVSREFQMAVFAHKVVAALPISLLAMTATGACPGGIARVNRDDQHAFGESLIRDEHAQLKERPTFHAIALAVSDRYPVGDAAEVFDPDGPTGALSLIHNRSTDLMVPILPETGFVATDFAEMPLGALAPARLERFANTPVAITGRFNAIAAEVLTVGVGSQIDNSQVNTESFSRGNKGRRFVDDLDVQEVPSLPSLYQCGGSRMPTLEHDPLTVPQLAHQSLPRVEQCQRECPVLFPEAEDTLIVVDTGGFKHRTVFLRHLEGRAHPRNRSDRKVRRKAEQFPNLTVAGMLKDNLVRGPLSPRDGGNVVARLCKRLEGGVNLDNLFWGRSHFAHNGTNGLHGRNLITCDL